MAARHAVTGEPVEIPLETGAVYLLQNTGNTLLAVSEAASAPGRGDAAVILQPLDREYFGRGDSTRVYAWAAAGEGTVVVEKGRRP